MALSHQLFEFGEVRGLTPFGVFLGYRHVASWAVASTVWDTLTSLAVSMGEIGRIRVASHLAKDNVRTAGRFARRTMTGVVVVAVVASVLLGTVLGGPVCHLLSGGSVDVAALAEGLVPFLSIANVAAAVATACRSILGARGRPAPISAVATPAAVWAVSVPFASVFCLVLDFGLSGLAAGNAVGWILSAFVVTYHFLLVVADWNPYRRVGGGGEGTRKRPVVKAVAKGVDNGAPEEGGAGRGREDDYVFPDWSEDLLVPAHTSPTVATSLPPRGQGRAEAEVEVKISPLSDEGAGAGAGVHGDDAGVSARDDDSFTRMVRGVVERQAGGRGRRRQLGEPTSRPAVTVTSSSQSDDVEGDDKLTGGGERMPRITEEPRVSATRDGGVVGSSPPLRSMGVPPPPPGTETAGVSEEPRITSQVGGVDSSKRRGLPPPPPPQPRTSTAGARELFPRDGDGTLSPPPPEAFALSPGTSPPRQSRRMPVASGMGTLTTKNGRPEQQQSMVPTFDDPYDYDGADADDVNLEYDTEESTGDAETVPVRIPPPPPPPQSKDRSEDDGNIPLIRGSGEEEATDVARTTGGAASLRAHSEMIRPNPSVEEVDTTRSLSLSRTTVSNPSLDFKSFDEEEEAGGVDVAAPQTQADADTVQVRNFNENEVASSFAAAAGVAPTQSWTGSNVRSFDDESLEPISVSRRAGPNSAAARDLNEAATASMSRNHMVREEDLPSRADATDRDDDGEDADDATDDDNDNDGISDDDDVDDEDERLPHRTTRTDEEESSVDDGETDCTQKATDDDSNDDDDDDDDEDSDDGEGGTPPPPPAPLSSAGPRILEDGPKVGGGGGQHLPSLQPWWATKSSTMANNENVDDSFQH